MKKLWLAISLLLLVAPEVGAEETYMLGYAGFAGFQASMWAVKDYGLLKKYGLEGETVLVPGTSRQIQALVEGEVHVFDVPYATGPAECLHLMSVISPVAGCTRSSRFPRSGQ